ncbi:MAG: class I SAM-dependent methyltransferase [Planctomycetota bacterium]
MTKTKEISCSLCGRDEYRFLFDAKDRLHGFDGSFSYVICRNCGLVYMNPQVSMSDLADFYPSDYAPHQSKPNKSNLSQKRMRKKSLLPEYILRSLNENTVLLDVGCGNGKFLDEIKKCTNTQVCGLDISKAAVETAKENFGLDIFCGSITEAPFEDGSFDLITAWQYLEHVPRPLKVLRRFYQLLKPNGICIISTPNFDSMNAKIFKDRWYCLDCPRHLHIYTPDTINKLMEKAGFAVTEVRHDTSSKNLIRSLQYYFYGNNYTPEYRDKVKKTLVIKSIVSPITRVFALLRKSDNIIVSARKRNPK